MTLDMYSDKVAEASALIREFAKVDYFHYFARDPESSLEAFIAMLDQAEEKGRQSQAARIAELKNAIHRALNSGRGTSGRIILEASDEQELRTALSAAPSAPAVERQPVKPWENRMEEYFAQGSVRMRTPAYFMADEIIDWRKIALAAAQAADTDKVREALKTLTDASEIFMAGGVVGLRQAIDNARLVLSMAAQAPVREVPGWKLVPIEPTDEMRAACINACYSDHIDEDWAAMLAAAPLPAAPVREVPGWQPIETAPKDGTHVLCYAPELQFVGFYGDPINKWCYMAPGVPVAPTQPTHWMPLPAAPVQQEGDHAD